jgi:formylglycine-generating enzyme required for sulfatase activity
LTDEREQRDDDEHGFGPAVVTARDAALTGRPVAERLFRVEVPDAPDWPRPEMVAIPPGRFVMGSPGRASCEGPQHEVQIGYVLALGCHPVTVDEFAVFISDSQRDLGNGSFWTGSKWSKGVGWRDPGFEQGNNHPVTCLLWQEMGAYLTWLNKRLGILDRPDLYRFPSEAEWEFACRAGTETPFGFGEAILPSQANFDGATTGDAGQRGEHRKGTTPVGSFPPNAMGLYDMHGNVFEWIEDAWHADYQGAPADGSAWIAGGIRRLPVLRGGSWRSDARSLRSAHRICSDAMDRDNSIGFRVARTLLSV